MNIVEEVKCFINDNRDAIGHKMPGSKIQICIKLYSFNKITPRGTICVRLFDAKGNAVERGNCWEPEFSFVCSHKLIFDFFTDNMFHLDDGTKLVVFWKQSEKYTYEEYEFIYKNDVWELVVNDEL